MKIYVVCTGRDYEGDFDCRYYLTLELAMKDERIEGRNIQLGIPLPDIEDSGVYTSLEEVEVVDI